MWWRHKHDPAATRALAESEEVLRSERAKWADVRAVSARTRRQIRQNHFAPTIARALGERRS